MSLVQYARIESFPPPSSQRQDQHRFARGFSDMDAAAPSALPALMDLSNLYSQTKKPPAKQTVSIKKAPPQRHTSMESLASSASSLYPSIDSLPPDLTSVDDILAGAGMHSNSKLSALERQQVRCDHYYQVGLSTAAATASPTQSSNTSEDDFDDLNASFPLLRLLEEESNATSGNNSDGIPQAINIPDAAPNTPQYHAEEQVAQEEEEKEEDRFHGNHNETSPSNNVIQIEIAPGQFLPLRSSSETVWAVESGTAREVCCYNCQASLATVPDCQAVICPDCRMISPMDHDDEHDEMEEMEDAPQMVEEEEKQEEQTITEEDVVLQLERDTELWSATLPSGAPSLHRSLPTLGGTGSSLLPCDGNGHRQRKSTPLPRGVGLGLKRGMSFY